MSTTTEITPTMPPQNTTSRRRKNPVIRDQYFVNWTQYQSVWHLPDHWIAEALNYTVSGVAAARKREAREQLKQQPMDGMVWLQTAYPEVDGKRYTSEMIVDLLMQISSLEHKLNGPEPRTTRTSDNYTLIGILVFVVALLLGILSASIGILGGHK